MIRLQINFSYCLIFSIINIFSLTNSAKSGKLCEFRLFTKSNPDSYFSTTKDNLKRYPFRINIKIKTKNSCFHFINI